MPAITFRCSLRFRFFERPFSRVRRHRRKAISVAISFCRKKPATFGCLFATVDFFSPSDPPPASKLAPPKKYEGSSKLYFDFFVERETNLFFFSRFYSIGGVPCFVH